MGLQMSRRIKALLGLMAAALSAGCPPVNPPVNGPPPNEAVDRQAIAALLGTKEVAPFFQSRLINDGVGIFSAGSEVMPAGFPRRWGRSYAYSVQGGEPSIADATSVQFNTAREATGLYKQHQAGKLVLDYTWQRKLLAKPFIETALRTARFRKVDGAWRLSDVSVTRIRPEPSALKAGAFALSADGQPPWRFLQDDWLSVENLPVVRPDQRGRVEVELAYSGVAPDPAFYAFLSVPPMRDRLRLRDDGQAGDRQARDGVYSAEFFFPGEPGLKQLVIDALAGKTFAESAMTNYDATQWGIPYRVEGGEAR